MTRKTFTTIAFSAVLAGALAFYLACVLALLHGFGVLTLSPDLLINLVLSAGALQAVALVCFAEGSRWFAGRAAPSRHHGETDR